MKKDRHIGAPLALDQKSLGDRRLRTPCATIASAPARSASRASARVVAQANHAIP
jgi:hypothetical protein